MTNTTVEQTIFVIGDVGRVINATIRNPDNTPLDISTATTKDFRVRKPDGTADTWATSFIDTGTDGRITYVTVLNDIDQTGEWLLEAHIVSATQDLTTVTQEIFRVRGKI